MTSQMRDWRLRAVDAVGVSASLGISLGGAAVTLAGAISAGVQGVVQGATDAARSSSNARVIADQAAPEPLPPPPDPPPEMRPQPRAARQRSDSDPSTSKKDPFGVLPGTPCPRCQGDKRKHHTYETGLCQGFPPEVLLQ